jgi:GT2 family glycosyltransferase
LFVDDDAAVLDDVASLVEYLNANVCQGIQPLILRFDQATVDSAGDFVRKRKASHLIPYSQGFSEPLSSVIGNLKVEEVPSMRSAFMIMRKPSFSSVGGFDEMLTTTMKMLTLAGE